MISAPPPPSLRTQWLRRRLLWTAVLLLVCLGGAGLVAAVDRPVTQATRPEVSWQADQAAAPWLAELRDSLEALDADVAALSSAGRRVLIALSTLAIDQLDSHIEAGDLSAAELGRTLGTAVALRESPPAGLETWRLGDQNAAALERIDTALVAAGEVPQLWQRIASSGRAAGQLLAALGRHDELALVGLNAGSDARWRAAVSQLELALSELEAAAALRAQLDEEVAAVTLDQLLADHRRHDEALLALYAYLAQGGSLDDSEASDLRAAVERARQPVPTPPERLQSVVAEAFGPPLSEALSANEAVRGSILDAVDAGDAEPEGQPADHQPRPADDQAESGEG